MNKLTRETEVLYVVWDNKDETLELIREEMLPKLNVSDYQSFSVGRCYNEKTDKNDSDVMFISTKTPSEGGTSNAFERVGNYIVLDYSPLDKYGIPNDRENQWGQYHIHGYSKENFERFYGN